MQTEAGNFRYQYDWQTGAYSTEDTPVRQAGTLWGLANLHRLRPQRELYAMCRKGTAFYDQYSRTTNSGGRFTTYPGNGDGYLGSVALVALALIELLRANPPDNDTCAARWRPLLDEYLRFLLDSQSADGRWPSRYDAASGKPYGEPSAFFDGEALLALTRAARHLGIGGMEDAITLGAAGGYRRYVLLALRRDHGSPHTLGYYQWGTMAMYEMIAAGWPESEQYESIVYYLADWICRIRRLGHGRNNPAASLEGLIHAYDLARSGAPPEQMQLYRDTVEAALGRMLSLQVGHPRASDFVRRAPQTAPALGGCQHVPDRSKLRIDFTMHQLHAALLASEMVVPDRPA